MDVNEEDADNSVIVLGESPVTHSSHLKRPGLLNNENSPPKFALLDSVAARFQQQASERAERLETLKAKQQSQLAHSRYLKENVVTQAEISSAAPVVNEWAKKHDVVGKTKRRILTAKRKTTSKPSMGDSSLIVISPTLDRSYDGGVTFHKHHNIYGFDKGHSSRALDNGRPNIAEQKNYKGTNLSSVSPPGPYNLSCSILNCDTVFTSEEYFQEHKRNFRHSPCNPCVNIPNSEAPYLPQCYLCPSCGRDYPDDISCGAHMCKTKHVEFHSPLEVSVYCCPLCCQFFSSKELCATHMNERNHHDIAYPFEDDMRNPSIEPIAVGTGLMDDFITECQKISFRISCIECEMEITSSRELHNHELETQNSHVMSAHCQSTPAEVFVSYMKEKTCTSCLQLFSASECEGDVHNCTDQIQGIFIENDCKTFAEFVRRCSLTYQNRLKSSKKTLLEPPPINVTSPPSLYFGARAKGSPESFTLPRSLNQPSTLVSSNHSRTLSGESSSCATSSVPSLHFSDQSMDIYRRPASSTCQSVASIPNNVHKDMTSVQSSVQSNAANCVELNTNGSASQLQTQNSKLVDIGKECISEVRHVEEDHSEIPKNLETMKSILFLDLDNWPSFFRKLPFFLPERTFVWGFYGGGSQWKEPSSCDSFSYQKNNGWFRLHEKCGKTKDAADFALVLMVGRMDERLPKTIAFVILSGDKGFCEIDRQMKNSTRRTVTINPHHTSDTIVHTMIKSVVDS